VQLLRQEEERAGIEDSSVATGEYVFDVLEGESAGFEQHQEVVDEVGALFEQALIVPGGGFEGDFNALLTHFLGNFFGAGMQQPGGVGGARVALRSAERDNALQHGQEMLDCVIVFVPAGIGARVARRAERVGLDEEGIAIATSGPFDTPCYTFTEIEAAIEEVERHIGPYLYSADEPSPVVLGWLDARLERMAEIGIGVEPTQTSPTIRFPIDHVR